MMQGSAVLVLNQPCQLTVCLNVGLLGTVWQWSVIVYYFLWKSYIITKGSLMLFPKQTLKIADEWSIPHPALSAPSLTGKEWCRMHGEWHFLFCETGNMYKTDSMWDNCKQKFHLPIKLILNFFLSHGVYLYVVDVHIQRCDSLGLFSKNREVILTRQFFGLFSQLQQNILAILLPAQILFIWVLSWWGWSARIQFMNGLLKHLKVSTFLLDSWVYFETYLRQGL